MDTKTIKTITNKISRRFPEVANVKPQVKKVAAKGIDNTLLLYKTKVSGPGGASIQRVVRVVCQPNGKIIKISTSR